MRTSNDKALPSALFVRDEGPKYICVCSNCVNEHEPAGMDVITELFGTVPNVTPEKQLEIVTDSNVSPQYCPKCGLEVVYRTWFEW